MTAPNQQRWTVATRRAGCDKGSVEYETFLTPEEMNRYAENKLAETVMYDEDEKRYSMVRRFDLMEVPADERDRDDWVEEKRDEYGRLVTS